MTKVVYVVGGDRLVVEMFMSRCWTVVVEQESARHVDLVCLTGGEDVTPSIYGQPNLGSVGCNLSRDQEEVEVYNHYRGEVPMVGICRGGQLLNVLNGGKMVQDHGLISGVVSAWSLYEQDGKEHEVLVDHHQGILPTKEASGFIHGPDIPSGEHIAYACFYKDTRSLCFQPHPEWGHKPTEDLFFQLLENYLS